MWVSRSSRKCKVRSRLERSIYTAPSQYSRRTSLSWTLMPSYPSMLISALASCCRLISQRELKLCSGCPRMMSVLRRTCSLPCKRASYLQSVARCGWVRRANIPESSSSTTSLPSLTPSCRSLVRKKIGLSRTWKSSFFV